MTAVSDIAPDDLQKAYATEAANIPKFGGKLSELCKYVWAGSLAITYALATTEKVVPAFTGVHRLLWIAAAGAGALALLFDYLQYLAAFIHARGFVDWIESAPKPIDREQFNRNTISAYSQANAFFFWAKNFVVFVAAALIASAVIGTILA